MAKKKKPDKRSAAVRQRSKLAAYFDALGAFKEATKDVAGMVSVVDSTPALRRIVEAWPGLPHMIDAGMHPAKASSLLVRIWACHSLDLVDAADQCGLDPHVFIRMFDRARKFGIIYPDGTLHPTVEQYVKERGTYAIVPPTKG